MPITENGFEYTIPKEIYDLIQDEFWNNFRHELYMIGGLSLCEEFCYSALDSGGTAGWTVAMYNTCKISSCLWLFEYYNSLQWYESDIFDRIVSEEILKRSLVKTYSLHEMAKKTIFKEEDIDSCVKCGKPFLRKEMIEDNECEGFYYCYNCTQDNKNCSDYYKKSNEEMRNYMKKANNKSTILL